MILFKDRWRKRLETPAPPLSDGEAWAIISTCLLLFALLAIVRSIDWTKMSSSCSQRAEGCRCSE
jgi:hypothetical protein